MTLEQEWARQRGIGPSGTPRPPSTFDRLARAVAWIILLVFAGATVWVATLVTWGLFFVIGAMILTLVWMGGRIHELNVQLREVRARLEAREAEIPPTPPPEPPRH